MTVLRSGSATDVGRVRNSNQDLAFEGSNLFAVADGMGGHVGGEVAARVAVESLQSAFGHQSSMTGLRQAVAAANAAVWRRSQEQEELRGMGTTLTAAALVAQDDGRDAIALANVGDSRAYVFSGGQITQVTADHSLAEEKVRQGELTEAQAAVHPHRHILTRALGVSPDVDVDLWSLHLQSGDRILLCSDGLTNEVTPERIAEILSAEPDPSEAARALVRAANDNGGNDNITVVVIDVLIGEGEAAGGAPVHGPDTEALFGIPPASEGTTAAEGPLTEGLGGLAALEVPPEPEVTRGPGYRQRRRERRRQRRMAGIPRRITFRVLLFAVLMVALVAGGYGFLRWYSTNNWYVKLDGSHLAIYQGRPGGFLWFEPKLVDKSPVTTSGVSPLQVPTLHHAQQFPTLAAAKKYIATLHETYLTQQRVTSGQSTVTTTTKPAPTTTTTSTTTTTVFG